MLPNPMKIPKMPIALGSLQTSRLSASRTGFKAIMDPTVAVNKKLINPRGTRPVMKEVSMAKTVPSAPSMVIRRRVDRN